MKLIGNKHLQTIAANLGIVKYFLYVGQTEENILSNTKTLADAFEALIGNPLDVNFLISISCYPHRKWTSRNYHILGKICFT